MFYVGQKVVCVNDGPSQFTKCPSAVVKGRVYTVTRAWKDVLFDHPVVTLAEIAPPPGHNAFDATRFRPLTDQKKSVSFTAGAPDDSEHWDNRRKIVEPAKVEGEV